jgi:hypothetical protein
MQLSYEQHSDHVEAIGPDGRARGKTVDEATAQYTALYAGRKPNPLRPGQDGTMSVEEPAVDTVLTPDLSHSDWGTETYAADPVLPQHASVADQLDDSVSEPRERVTIMTIPSAQQLAAAYRERNRAGTFHDPEAEQTRTEKQIIKMLSDLAGRIDKLEEARDAPATDTVAVSASWPWEVVATRPDPTHRDFGQDDSMDQEWADHEDIEDPDLPVTEVEVLRDELAMLRSSLATNWRNFVAQPSLPELMLIGLVPLLQDMLINPTATCAKAIQRWLDSLEPSGMRADLIMLGEAVSTMRPLLRPDTQAAFDRVFGSGD